MAKKAVSLNCNITAEYATHYEKVRKNVCVIWARKFGTPEVIAEDIAGNAVFLYHKMKADGKEYSDGRFFGTLMYRTMHWKDSKRTFYSMESHVDESGLENYIGFEDKELEVNDEYQHSIQMLCRKFGRDTDITNNILDDYKEGYNVREMAKRNGVTASEVKKIMRDFNI